MKDDDLHYELIQLKNFLGLCVAAPAGAQCPIEGVTDGCFACVAPHEAAKRVRRVLGHKPPNRSSPMARRIMLKPGAPWINLPANLFLRADELPPPSGCDTQPVYFRHLKRKRQQGPTYTLHAIAFADNTIWTARRGFAQKPALARAPVLAPRRSRPSAKEPKDVETKC